MADQKHVEALKAFRERAVEERRSLVENTAEVLEKGGAIIAMQDIIEAVDEAIDDERRIALDE